MRKPESRFNTFIDRCSYWGAATLNTLFVFGAFWILVIDGAGLGSWNLP